MLPLLVRIEGLEPPRRKPPEPKSGVSTNFTTSANLDLFHSTIFLSDVYSPRYILMTILRFFTRHSHNRLIQHQQHHEKQLYPLQGPDIYDDTDA